MERTEKFLAKVKKDANHLTSTAGWYGVKEQLAKLDTPITPESIGTYAGWFPVGRIDVYRYEGPNGIRYAAEFGYQTDIDDYCIEVHVFSKKPTPKDVRSAVEAERLEFRMRYPRGSINGPEFTCWECGRSTHWLDTPGDLSQRIANLEERYCGC